MREKLIEFIRKADKEDYESRTQDEHYAYMADHLIANGVTFATDNNVGGKWITKNGITFCSECLTCGSKEWKCCPVCEAKMGSLTEVVE